MKYCSKCFQLKPLDNFYMNTRSNDGHSIYCRECTKLYQKGKSKKPRPIRRGSIEKGILECTRCHKLLALDNFYYRAERDRYDSWCNNCRNEVCKHNKSVKRDTLYCLMPGQYDEILKSQGGVCAICGSIPSIKIPLTVDHNHQTGAIRGLLCGKCNRGLGHFNDDLELFKLATTYLEKSSGKI